MTDMPSASCPRCGSTTFSFSPCYGPIKHIQERDKVLAEIADREKSLSEEIESWYFPYSSTPESWLTKELESVNECFCKEFATLKDKTVQLLDAIYKTNQAEVAEIEMLYQKRKNANNPIDGDPYIALYDSPEEARDVSLLQAEKKREQERQKVHVEAKQRHEALKREAERKKEELKREAAHRLEQIAERVFAERRAFDAWKTEKLSYCEINEKHMVVIVFCCSCGYIIGPGPSPSQQDNNIERLTGELQAINKSIQTFSQVILSYLHSVVKDEEARRKTQGFISAMNALGQLIEDSA